MTSDNHSSRMNKATDGAVLNVTYGLIANMKYSFQKYHSSNILRDPTDYVLAYNMRAANSRYTKRLQH